MDKLPQEVKALTDSIFGFACGMNRQRATMPRQEAAYQPETMAARDHETGPTVRRVRTIDELIGGAK